MVTNGAKEEHLTLWRDGAGLAGSQPHASFSLCSAPEKAGIHQQQCVCQNSSAPRS